jgi:hypothetical protein
VAIKGWVGILIKVRGEMENRQCFKLLGYECSWYLSYLAPVHSKLEAPFQVPHLIPFGQLFAACSNDILSPAIWTWKLPPIGNGALLGDEMQEVI